MNTWQEHEAIDGQPLAAPLPKCAQLLGVTLAELQLVAARVEPYQHADGTPRWSLYQLDRHLHPERYGQGRSRAPTLTALGVADRRRNARTGA